MKVVIYNDTFKDTRPHFGCDLVMSTYSEQLDRVGIELLGTVSMKDKSCTAKILEKADLVIVNGEGSFHHNRRNDLAKVSHMFPSILINTVFESNNVDLSKFKFISARESTSASNIGCEVIPDIIFTSKRLQSLKRIGNDHSKVMHHEGIKTLQVANTFLPKLLTCSSIETESFHAIAVATILGIKITKIYPGAGVSWKTFSLLEDIQANSNYVEGARLSIDNLFEGLHDL
jgi:hypothetical protein